jgi:hypothetical protein
MRALAVAACGLALTVSPAVAQQRLRGMVFADGALVQLGTQQLGARESLTGPTFAAEGRVSLGRVSIGAGYLEGRLQPGSSGGPSPLDLVEGQAFVAVEPLPWLELSLGPHLRAFVKDSSTERWVSWPVRARVQTALPGTTLETYVALWRALSATVNLAESIDHVQGGEAGVVWRPRGTAVWLRLGYRVDGASLIGGNLTETVEAVSFAVGIGGRQ